MDLHPGSIPTAHRPVNGTKGPLPHGPVSKTRPWATSSQESQVCQGVAPPAQFAWVRARMRYADPTDPSAAKRTADAPPPTGISEFET